MRCRGFTLLELIAAMSVAAVLATLAFPTYRDVLHRARRVDARLALQRIAYLQEKHHAEHLRYARHLDGNSATPDTLASSDHSDAGDYALSVIASDDGQSYRAVAQTRAGGRQAADRDCQQLSIDETGRRGSADSAGNWSTTDAHRCWS
jgi:type IV pilus assembly protein PilE